MSNGVAKRKVRRLTERDLVSIKCDFFQHFKEEEPARSGSKRVFCENITPYWSAGKCQLQLGLF
jgi:hypothetical protein